MRPVTGHDHGQVLNKVISPYQSICALDYGDGPLGIFAHGKAGDVQISGFFLQTARVGDDNLCARHYVHEIDVR